MSTRVRTRDWLVLAGFVLLCLAVGAVAGAVTADAIETWYRGLVKPSWTPPDWAFAPAWTTLYILMAIAAWRVWRAGSGWAGRARLALALFVVQLALNFVWSFVFFAARAPGWALVEIVLLWLAIAATMAAFRPVDRPAMWLMMPYLAWVSFATCLNAAIWWMN